MTLKYGKSISTYMKGLKINISDIKNRLSGRNRVNVITYFFFKKIILNIVFFIINQQTFSSVN